MSFVLSNPLKRSIVLWHDMEWYASFFYRILIISVSMSYLIQSWCVGFKAVERGRVEGAVAHAGGHLSRDDALGCRVLAQRLHHAHSPWGWTAGGGGWRCGEWRGPGPRGRPVHRELAQPRDVAGHAALAGTCLYYLFWPLEMFVRLAVTRFFARFAWRFEIWPSDDDGFAARRRWAAHRYVRRDVGAGGDATSVVVVHFVQRHVGHPGRHSRSGWSCATTNIPNLMSRFF